LHKQDHSIGHYRKRLSPSRIRAVKTLCTALAAALAVGAALAGGAAADSNSLAFNEGQGSDGEWHIDVGVSYVFPGLPPRNYDYGLGTVRITLPTADLSVDPSQPPDAGYDCVAEPPSAVICSSAGYANGAGLDFPTSITVHMIARNCWSASGGVADVWSAPNDPGTAPDVSLPIDPGDCSAATVRQPVLDTKPLRCTVPNLRKVPLRSATRRLANAKCRRGRVTYKHSATVKKNSVISQSIKPGKVLRQGTKVDLVVSRG
jgi:hypothetical protein